ncbi:MoxR family ATPase [Aestuariicella hydrocarbonica]|uniref:MoxR family ATPase n=1 Tax=Pseudomaricurvus hydrocarbonicus TaxID=1470433 RepID=A0A9E5MHX3_9GAMM|nr:MoxR family ATPase [Aestuariicella hydrocarbonica]NHO66531.1 MoxR family ATPase [Aestuariicella hydrocarbonica]
MSTDFSQQTPQQSLAQLVQQIQQTIIGQQAVIEHLVIALLANGHVLLEGLPGTAKTRSIKALSKALQAELGRIQFTPDLLPADVTGTEVYHVDGDKETLAFQPGPLFHNLILADEINRAPAKVQSALLEAMEERQVTVAGKTYPLPQLFMVLATQNPIEQEGTYPLPEAQMDRFLLKVDMDYPDDDSELSIIRLVRGEELQPQLREPVVDENAVFAAREQIKNLHISEAIEHYIVALVMATRHPERYSEDLRRWIAFGASPRASLALDRCARARAWLCGRDHVIPEDVQAVALQVMGHRIQLSYEAQAEGVDTRKLVETILQQVAVA